MRRDCAFQTSQGKKALALIAFYPFALAAAAAADAASTPTVALKPAHSASAKFSQELPPTAMCMSDNGMSIMMRQHPNAHMTWVSEPKKDGVDAAELFYGDHLSQVYREGYTPETTDQIVVGFTCEMRYAHEGGWTRCTTFGDICNSGIRFQNYNAHDLPAVVEWSFQAGPRTRIPGTGTFGRISWYTVPGKPS